MADVTVRQLKEYCEARPECTDCMFITNEIECGIIWETNPCDWDVEDINDMVGGADADNSE